MSNIGEPQRFIIAEPEFEPVPGKQPAVEPEEPVTVPDREEVPAE